MKVFAEHFPATAVAIVEDNYFDSVDKKKKAAKQEVPESFKEESKFVLHHPSENRFLKAGLAIETFATAQTA